MNFSELTSAVVSEGAARNQEKESDKYVQRQWQLAKNALLLAAGLVGNKASMKYLGMPLATYAAAVIGARVATEVVGTVVSDVIDPDEGVENWQYASNTMFSWWGLEFIGLGPYNPLQYIPNPVGVGTILFESGVAIGEYGVENGVAQPDYSDARMAAMMEMYARPAGSGYRV